MGITRFLGQVFGRQAQADGCIRDEQFRSVFDNSSVGMVIASTDAVLLDGNQAWLDFMGCAREDVVGKSLFALTFHEDIGPDRERLAAVVRGDATTLQRDKRYIRKDGSTAWASVSVSALRRDAGGQATTMMAVVQDIRARKCLEEELANTRELLELAVRSSDVAVFTVEMPEGRWATGRQRFINCFEPLGYAAPEPYVSRDDLATLLPASEAVRVPRTVRDYLQGKLPVFEIEHQLRHRDGSLRWKISRGAAVRNAQGKATRFVGTLIDVTDKRLVEKELRESEQRWRTLIDALPLLVWSATSRGEVNYYGAQFLAYSGLADGTLGSGSWLDVVHPDDRGASRRAWEDAVASRGALELEHRLRRADGSYRWFTTRAVIADPDDPDFTWLVTSVDMHARKQLEEDLHRTKETLELAIRGSEVGIWEYDAPDGDIANARQSLINVWEMLGYDSADDTLPDVADVVHPDDLERVTADVNDYLAGRSEVFGTEHRARHKDGSYRDLLARGVATRDEAGAVLRFVGASVDITEIKRISADLQTAREAAESANRAKDEFLAKVSHEIRTPLNAVLGLTEICLDASEDDKQRKLLSTVRVAAKSLLAIINDLLDFSKIAAGKLALDEADFSLREVLAETVDALDPRALRTGIELSLAVHPNVPDALRGDVPRLRQVLTNLVGNAIKFTPKGQVSVEASLRAEDEFVWVEFLVRDTGIGIHPGKQAAIFRAFEQEDSSTTRKYGGTGLGLTIAAQLVGLMGGEITVESELGKGSTFAFTARFSRAHASPIGPQPRELAREGRVADLGSSVGRLRVLVAEDNPLNTALVRELLDRAGHVATFAADGPSALELAKDGRFDLLLLDLHLPELDGFAVAQAIRQHERDRRLPIVAVTARHADPDRVRCLAAGMDGFLAKPIDAAALLATIERIHLDASASLLDREVIVQACAGDQAILDAMCRAARRSLPAQLARIFAAMASDDMEGLRQAAHAIRGTLGVFSSLAGGLAGALEDGAARGDRPENLALAARLQLVAAQLLLRLRGLRVADLAR